MEKTVAILVGRLIFGAVFLMAASFKFMGMSDTAKYIAAAGFPIPLVLAWLAAIFEMALVVAFLTGAFFSYAACLAAAYIVFLGFAFHGPSHWQGNQAEFGFFVDHFTFLAGLMLPRSTDRETPGSGEFPAPSGSEPEAAACRTRSARPAVRLRWSEASAW